MRTFLARLLLILSIPILLGSFLQACGGGGGGTAPVTNIQSITIDPVNSSIAVGTKVQLHATANYKNKTTKDITDSVTWESADKTVVLVSNAAAIKGLAGGSGVGATSVSATLHGVIGVSAFTVTKASLKSITVVPVNPFVSKGTTVQMAALGNFSDGSVQNLTTLVSWSSGNSSIAQVSNTAGTIGLVTGVSVGNTPITATFNGIQGSTTVTVSAATLTSITITSPVDTIAKGTTVQLTATCNLSDGTTLDCTSLVSWTSGNAGIAQVSNTSPTKGLVTGVAVGNTTISGSLGAIQGSATVTVTAATLTSIAITPPDPTIANGTTVQLTATGVFSDGTTEDLTNEVSWTSSNLTIAQVSNVPNTQGLVTALAQGNTSITATLDGIEGSTTVTVSVATLTSITITPPDSSIAKGTTVQLTATGDFSDGTTQDLTTQVSWTSGNNAIAEVNNVAGSQGAVTGLSVGNTSITATLNGIEGSTTVTVTAATLTSITITPPDPSIAKGTTVQLTATGNFSDATTQDLTTQVSWTSGNNGIAPVGNIPSSKGRVFGVGAGSTSITATLDGTQGSTTVTVTAATLTSIVITPPDPSIAKGTTVQMTATGTFSDGSKQPLTDSVAWKSAPASTATVDPTGLVKGIAEGTATITATETGVSGSTTVIVTPATLTTITIFPTAPISVAAGTTQQLTAIGTFSDGTTQDLTTSAHWTSMGNATVSPTGLVTGTSVGSSTITANQAGVSGSTTVTVTSATLVAIVVTPSNQTIGKGNTTQLAATGAFSDSSIQDFTASANWMSSAPAIASVGSTGNNPGLVTGVAVGGATITATQLGVSGTTTVTVAPPPEFAYMTNDTSNTVSVFSVGSDGALTAIFGSPFVNPGRTAASVTADPSGKFLYTANIVTGDVTEFAITQSGPNIGALTLIGTIPSGAAAFGIAVVPSGLFAYVGNVGANTVSGFSIAPSTGALTAVTGSPFSTLPATNPEGMAAAPRSGNKFIYTAASGSNQVAGFRLSNSGSGALTPISGSPFPSPPNVSHPQSITLDPSGMFAYTANSLPSASAPFGNVSAYMANIGNGALTFVDNVNAGTAAGGPVMVAVDPSSKFAYVAGGGDVFAFNIAAGTGKLSAITGSPFTAGLNTTWVAVDPSGKFVYVTTHGGIGGGPGPLDGGVSAYQIGIDGALTPISGLSSLPRGPSSITVVAVP